MAALYLPPSTSVWNQGHVPATSVSDSSALCNVAFSVAEAALNSGPNSPSFNRSMAELMDAPLDNNMWAEPDSSTWPQLKTKRASSFAGTPLWGVVEHAKERQRNAKSSSPESPPYYPTHPRRASTIDTYQPFTQEVLVTTRSADPSPVESGFSHLHQLQHALPRLSARDFAQRAEQRAAATAHARTQSDINKSPTQLLQSQALRGCRPNTRLPSLAQIQAKMHRAGSLPIERPSQTRSDSIDSVESEGPQTPTEEATSFDLFYSPRLAESKSPRLAPFLRERTNGRLARPKSMPPVYGDHILYEDPDNFQSPSRSSATGSAPSTPQSERRMAARWARFNHDDITLVVTPPKASRHDPPTSPTESVVSSASIASSNTSVVSATPSLPIITCTPADEPDSDEESEGDVIVFNGEYELDDDDEADDQSEREKRGLAMRFALSRRST